MLVKTGTDASKLSAAIVSYYEKSPSTPIVLRVVGAGALNQAVKGAIISNKYFCKKGLKASLVPSFKDLSEGMTAIQMRIVLLNL